MQLDDFTIRIRQYTVSTLLSVWFWYLRTIILLMLAFQSSKQEQLLQLNDDIVISLQSPLVAHRYRLGAIEKNDVISDNSLNAATTSASLQWPC